MLNDDGGVIDDLIFYFRRDDSFLVVFNASTADKVLATIERRLTATSSVTIRPRRDLRCSRCRGRRRGKFWRWRPHESRAGPGAIFAAEWTSLLRRPHRLHR